MSGSLLWWVIVMAGVVMIRWEVSFFEYSGYGKPPMYGDYEAQRHWQEVTYNLPIRSWYVNSTENDLQYWGLDYPPLTAYHSYIVGAIAHRINSSWVDLFSSRGVESPEHKLFMRATVLATDFLIMLPAVVLYFCSDVTNNLQNLGGATLFLLYPGLILIDYGHFQYNNVSLGLFLLAVALLRRRHNLWGSAAFTLALHYKQMELYHALPFFFFLLGDCYREKKEYRVWRLLKIGVVVVGLSALCWLPFLTDPSHALQVFNRIFPVVRGLYEDKVANFWCTVSLLVKLRQVLTTESQILLCAVVTVLAVLPSSIHLFFRPSQKRFEMSLVINSLSFFLFSFHVHEKTILIAAIPVFFLIKDHPLLPLSFGVWSTFSMLPLLLKDGLGLPTLACTGIFILMYTNVYRNTFEAASWKFWIFVLLSGSIQVSLAACLTAVPPPPRYPDLWPVLIAMTSSTYFILTWAYCNYIQLIALTTPGTGHKIPRRGKEGKKNQ